MGSAVLIAVIVLLVVLALRRPPGSG